MTQERNKRIIPMTYDRMFKSVLTSKEGRPYLIDIISNITKIPKENIEKDMVFRRNEYEVVGISEKKKISDMVVEVKEGVINLEMNKSYYEGIIDRNYEYITKIRESLIKEGEDYKDIKKVIQINFDNYNIYRPDKRVVIKFEMLDYERRIREGVSIESYHIILPNVKEKYYNEGSKNELVRKLVIMMAENSEELEKLIRENQELRKVGEKMVEISRDEELQGWYDEEEHQRKVKNTLIRSAIEKGWYEGKKEGIKEGIREGKKESIKEIVKNMISKGLSKDTISDMIGLSKEEVDNILQN